jgi:hypothetical protein
MIVEVLNVFIEAARLISETVRVTCRGHKSCLEAMRVFIEPVSVIIEAVRKTIEAVRLFRRLFYSL